MSPSELIDVLSNMPNQRTFQGFFRGLKNRCFSIGTEEGGSIEEFMVAMNSNLMFYNENRFKETLDWLSPNDYRKSLGLVT